MAAAVTLMSCVGVVVAHWAAYTKLPKLQKGWPRLTLVLLLLPLLSWPAWTIQSFLGGGVGACVFVGVSPAKLMAIAMDTPIDIIPPGSFFHFAIINLLPLKILNIKSYSSRRKNSHSSFQIQHLVPLLQITIVSISSDYLHHNREKLSHWAATAIYCALISSAVSLTLTTLGKLVQLIFRFEVAPSFNYPFLASSVSEFWGRRWNLVVTAILRANVYNPIISLFNTSPKTLIGSKSRKPDPQLNQHPLFARSVATLATFLVSGLVHEAIICYFNQSTHATWEHTLFFVLHGVVAVLEVFVRKRVFNDKLNLPRPVSIVLTLGFMYFTVDWLFLPPLRRTGSDAKAIAEIYGFQSMAMELLQNILSFLISPCQT